VESLLKDSKHYESEDEDGEISFEQLFQVKVEEDVFGTQIDQVGFAAGQAIEAVLEIGQLWVLGRGLLLLITHENIL